MISREDYSKLAQAYPILFDLPDSLQFELLRQAYCLNAQAGSILFEIDTPCTGYVMVMHGAIRISYPGNERDLLLYRVEPGDSCILTVSCLLGRIPYPAHGVAESALSGVIIPDILFHRLILDVSSFRAFVFSFLANRITQLMEMVQQIAFQRVDQRLARRLLSSADLVNVTHQQLADDLGSVREVISRHLKDFECSGFVHLERGQIAILDRTGLELLAG